MTNCVGKKRELERRKKEGAVNPSRSTGDRTTTQVYFFFRPLTIFRRPPFVRQLLLSLPVAGGKTGGLYGGLQATLFTHPLFRAPALRLPTRPPPPCDYIGYCLSLPPCRCRPRVVRHRRPWTQVAHVTLVRAVQHVSYTGAACQYLPQ